MNNEARRYTGKYSYPGHPVSEFQFFLYQIKGKEENFIVK